MRILLINGNTSEEITERIAADARRICSPGTEIKAVGADFGARLVLTRAHSVIAAHAVLTALAHHHHECDAAVVAIATDAGLAAAKQSATIPIVGMTEASLLTACMLGAKFGLLVFDRRALPIFQEIVSMYGQSERMAGMVAVDMATADFMDPGRVKAASRAAIDRLVSEWGAQSVVVTGATTAGLARALREEVPVPLVDGISAGVLQAEALARLRPTIAKGDPAAADSQHLAGIDAGLADFLNRNSK